MTLLVKFKSGKTVNCNDVVDVDLNKFNDYLYVYFYDGKILRCRAHAVKMYVQRYADNHENVVYPDKGIDC